MAKLVLADVSNLNQSAIATINQNWSLIEQAFETVLSRNGATPNQMTADLDLNGNDVINVDNVLAKQIYAELVVAKDLVVDGSTVSNIVKIIEAYVLETSAIRNETAGLRDQVAADRDFIEDLVEDLTREALAPINNPTFTGTPRAPTFTSSSNSTIIATTQHVKLAMADAAANASKITSPDRPAGDSGTDVANTRFVSSAISTLRREARSFPTRSAASAATIPDETTSLKVDGFSSSTDRGSGLYISVPNTGELKRWEFQSNSGTRRWSLEEHTVRPEMLGCVGGNLNVAAPFLQDCVAFLATRGGGQIYLTAGITYKTQRQWNITTSNVRVFGGGLVHRDDVPTSGQNVILVRNVKDVLIEGIRIAGNPALTKQTDNDYGVVIDLSERVTVRRCEIFNLGGMGVVAGLCAFVALNENVVHDCKSDGLHFTTGARLCEMRGNVITTCGDDLISLTHDNPQDGARPYDLVVADNLVQSSTWGAGIRVSHADRVVVSNNVIEDTSCNGILLAKWREIPGAHEVVIVGNIIRRPGRVYSNDPGQNPENFGRALSLVHGMSIMDGQHILIANNIVTDAALSPGGGTQATGICLDDNLVSVTVTGNSMYGCSRGIGTHNTEELPFLKLIDVSITNNTIAQSTSEGIWMSPVGGNFQGLAIKGNLITRCQAANAIYVARTGSDYLVIQDNTSPGKPQTFDTATCLNVELNDQTIGTWTPVLRGSNGTVVQTYTSSGTWIKQGGLVYVTAEWNVTAVGGASGALQITNMPFPRTVPTYNLTGRTPTGPTGFVNAVIVGGGGVANPSLVGLNRADGTSFVNVHSGNIAGTYRTER